MYNTYSYWHNIMIVFKIKIIIFYNIPTKVCHKLVIRQFKNIKDFLKPFEVNMFTKFVNIAHICKLFYS